MGTLGYYLALPLIYGISLLPFPLLYGLSDGVFLLVYHVFGYRKSVVLSNLRNSFPHKTDVEIQAIASSFYRWFCDLTLETLKTLTVSPKAIRERVEFVGTEILEAYAEKKQSIILVLGHFGNWELAGARYSLQGSIPPLYVIYHPLNNPHFDRLMYRMRTRHGTRLYTMKETTRAMFRDRNLLTATAFIADQTPSPDNAYWTTFLKQDTPIFFGTEAMARKLGFPVIYISVNRLRRGYYRMAVETLVSDPKNTREGEITEIHTCRLEREIQDHPDLWLWTHRRWKHKRPPASQFDKRPSART